MGSAASNEHAPPAFVTPAEAASDKRPSAAQPVKVAVAPPPHPVLIATGVVCAILAVALVLAFYSVAAFAPQLDTSWLTLPDNAVLVLHTGQVTDYGFVWQGVPALSQPAINTGADVQTVSTIGEVGEGTAGRHTLEAEAPMLELFRALCGAHCTRADMKSGHTVWLNTSRGAAAATVVLLHVGYLTTRQMLLGLEVVRAPCIQIRLRGVIVGTWPLQDAFNQMRNRLLTLDASDIAASASRAVANLQLARNVDPRTRTIVLGAGGGRGFVYVGMISALRAAGLRLPHICRRIYGCSVGALCALLWSLDIQSAEIVRMFDVAKPGVATLRDLLRAVRTFGVFERTAISNALKGVLRAHGLAEDATFQQLWALTGVEVRVVYVDLALQQLVYTDGNDPVVLSVCRSICVPGLFASDDWCVDGAVLSPVPLDHCGPPDRTLVFQFDGAQSGPPGSRSAVGPAPAPVLYIQQLWRTMGGLGAVQRCSPYWPSTVNIGIHFISNLHLNVEEDAIYKAVCMGYLIGERLAPRLQQDSQTTL